MKYSFLRRALLLILILSPIIYSQSIGLSIGSSYYYIAKDFNYSYLDSPLKNILLQYNFNLNDNFQLSFVSGYGWTSYNYHEVDFGPQFSSYNEYDVQSKGFPIETELKYQHYLTADSIFEPTIGIGIGYCNFKSTIRNVNIYPNQDGSDLTTKGFSQYISFGLNVHISNKITSSIEFKKLILSNIRITGSLHGLGYPYPYTFDEDYSSSTGLLDVGITLGVTYNL